MYIINIQILIKELNNKYWNFYKKTIWQQNKVEFGCDFYFINIFQYKATKHINKIT